jgi:hypothetical protein
MDERDAHGVAGFCRRHVMQAGDRRFLTPEPGADWRRELGSAARANNSLAKPA